MINKDLKKRIIDISYKKGTSHLGSCLQAVDIIESIYATKKESEPFILSSGHAALALYVVLEKHYEYNAAYLFNQHGVHPNRDMDHKIWASAGSLGHGIGIAVGYALSDRKRRVHCLISDGELAEGSVWEALRVAYENHLSNLIVHINDNGYGAYRETDGDLLHTQIMTLLPRVFIVPHITQSEFPFLQGIDAHYHVMTKDDYKLALEILNGKTTGNTEQLSA